MSASAAANSAMALHRDFPFFKVSFEHREYLLDLQTELEVTSCDEPDSPWRKWSWVHSSATSGSKSSNGDNGDGQLNISVGTATLKCVIHPGQRHQRNACASADAKKYIKTEKPHHLPGNYIDESPA
jgi:hypothetical protein